MSEASFREKALTDRLRTAISWMCRVSPDYGKMLVQAAVGEAGERFSRPGERVVVGFTILGSDGEEYGIEIGTPGWDSAKAVVEAAEAMAGEGLDPLRTELKKLPPDYPLHGGIVEAIRDRIKPSASKAGRE